jgi:RNA polymerase sigma-70 factor (ECF subfamily)
MLSILCARLTFREPSSLFEKEGIKSIGRVSISMDGDIYISKSWKYSMSLLIKNKPTAAKFQKLIRRHIQYLYNVALRYTANRYDAEEIVQETLLVAFRKFGQLKDEAKIKGWLFTILRNIYLKSVKNNKFSSSEYDDGRDYLDVLETAVEQIDLQAAYEKKVETEQVQALLSKLPEKYKSPLILYYMEDMSYQQIGDTLGLPIGTVMSRLSRGKQVLKKEILRQYLKESSQTNIVSLQDKRKEG